MSSLSFFESRNCKLLCTSKEAYLFVTDIRNFERFVPKETINDWKADRESCSFKVPMVGTVSLRIDNKEESGKVIYSGDALKKDDFSLTLSIIDDATGKAEARIVLGADLNPMMKIMAVKPIEQFLERLVSEMERFDGWQDLKE